LTAVLLSQASDVQATFQAESNMPGPIDVLRGRIFLLLALQAIAFAAYSEDTCGTPTLAGLTYQSDENGVGTLSVNYSFPNGDGNNYVQYSVDDVAWGYTYAPQSGTWTFALNTTCWTTGSHTISVLAVSCGRWSEGQYRAEAATTAAVNTTPTLSNVQFTNSSAGNGTLSAHYEFPQSAGPPERWIQLSIDGQPSGTTYLGDRSGTWTATINSSCWPTGQHTLDILAVACNRPGDPASRAEQTVPVSIDTTPKVEGLSAEVDDSGHCTLTAHYEFPNNAGGFDRWLQLSIDGQNVQTIYMGQSGTWTYSLETACMASGAHTVDLLGVSCNRWWDPPFRDLETTTFTVEHTPTVQITGFEERPDGIYALVDYEFPQTNGPLQRRLELLRSHSNALIGFTTPADRTGTWAVQITLRSRRGPGVCHGPGVLR
jgi:hypothetical protein